MGASLDNPASRVAVQDTRSVLPDLPKAMGDTRSPAAPSGATPVINATGKSLDEMLALPDLESPAPAGMTDLPSLPAPAAGKAGGAGADGAGGGAAEVVDEATQLQQQLEAATAQLQVAMQTIDTIGKTIGVLSKKITTLNKNRGGAVGDQGQTGAPMLSSTIQAPMPTAANTTSASGGAALFPDAGPNLVSFETNKAPMPDPGIPNPPQVTMPPETSGGATAAAGGAPGAPQDLSKLSYQISQFLVSYAPIDKAPNPHLPPIDELLETKIKLGATDAGYTALGKGKADIQIHLPQLVEPTSYTGEALQLIYVALAEALNKKGIYGVLVVPDPQDIDVNTGKDLREGRKQLRVLVFYSEISQIRTIAKGGPGGASLLDRPQDKLIAWNSPLKAGHGDHAGDLLNKDSLQEYISRLNRFPGRRVDAAINAAEEPGGIVLDYIIRQDKPLFAFAQVSNTGTESTGEWRARIGAEYRNALGLNDLFNLEYSTDTNGNSNSILGSYEVAILTPNILKAKVYASYGDFTASDVGFDLQNFTGDSTSYGAVVTLSPFTVLGYPIDFFAGIEWRDITVTNSTFPQEGESGFLLPYFGIGTEQVNDRYRVGSSVVLQTNLADAAGTKDGEELDALGRFNSDREFTILKWNFGASAFLEPIFGGKKWQAGEDWTKGKLAQELAFVTRGQYTFNDKRLVPQFEEVVGGFSSVRGYPESLTAGDTVIMGTAEYKIHLPKLLKPLDAIKKDKPPQPGMTPEAEEPPPKFALRPPTSGVAGGKPDWDLIARVFVDAAQTYNNQKLESAETDSTLLSTGVGLELQLSRYLNLRADWGVVLLKQDKFLSEPIEVGDNRFHLSLTLTW